VRPIQKGERERAVQVGHTTSRLSTSYIEYLPISLSFKSDSSTGASSRCLGKVHAIPMHALPARESRLTNEPIGLCEMDRREILPVARNENSTVSDGDAKVDAVGFDCGKRCESEGAIWCAGCERIANVPERLEVSPEKLLLRNHLSRSQRLDVRKDSLCWFRSTKLRFHFLAFEASKSMGIESTLQ